MRPTTENKGDSSSWLLPALFIIDISALHCYINHTISKQHVVLIPNHLFVVELRNHMETAIKKKEEYQAFHPGWKQYSIQPTRASRCVMVCANVKR